MVDINSETWAYIESMLKADKETAIQNLIKDIDSDKQRGRVEQINKILNLKDPKKIIPVDQDTYR